MADLTDASVRGIVRDELRDVKNDLKSLQHSISTIESRLSELRDVGSLAQTMQSAERRLHDIETRVKHAEEMSQYTAGYVAMRLKEKYDRESY